MITYSSPIGITISGEDSAVYGKPVLIAASNLRVNCTIQEGNEPVKDEFIAFLDTKILQYLQKIDMNVNKRTYNTTINSGAKFTDDISFKTAKIVAVLASLYEFYSGEKPESYKISKLAYQCEKEYFGYSLGYYTSTSVYGGIQFFRKEFEFLKSVSRLNFKFSDTIQNNLYILNFGPQGEESVFINSVKNNYNNDSVKYDILFSKLEKQTKRIVIAVAKEDPVMFSSSLKTSKEISEAISPPSDILSEKIKQLSFDTKLIGFSAQTRTGGLALVYSNDKKALENQVKKIGAEIYDFRLSESGLVSRGT